MTKQMTLAQLVAENEALRTRLAENETVVVHDKLAQTILDQVAEAVIVCDANGQVIRANERATMLCDRNPVGQMFQHVFDLEAAGETPFSLMEPVAWDQKRLEARLAHKGQMLDLLVSISPLLDDQRQRLGSVVVLTDITERKQIEKKILATSLKWKGCWLRRTSRAGLCSAWLKISSRPKPLSKKDSKKWPVSMPFAVI
jgi:PAS domain-containing protein